MLSTEDKARKFAEELDSAISFNKSLLSALESFTDSDKLSEKIGIFARQMPDWEILTEDSESGIDLIRRVCTGEMSIAQATELVKESIFELKITRRKLVKF